MDTRLGKVLIIIGFFHTFHLVQGFGQCSRFTIGTYDCVNLPVYDAPVYATCLTEEYVKQKTNNLAICQNYLTGLEVDHCWYSCMEELHGKFKGHVEDDCRCSLDGRDLYQQGHLTVAPSTIRPGHTTNLKAPTPTTTLIPNSCHSPDGKDCQFYEQCLKAKYSCPFTSNWNDIINYGMSICKLPDYRKTSISTNGTLWITGIQACIQVQMAPLLKQWLNYQCSSLDSKSEAIFEQCLDKPLDKIEICDVPLEDLWSLFWTLRGESNTNFVPSLSKFYAKFKNCTREKETSDTTLRVLVIKFSPTIDKYYESFVAKVVESESWKEKGLFWYAEQRYYEDTYTSEIYLLMTKRKGATDNTTLDKALNDFADKFETGQFEIYIDCYSYLPKTMYVCEDIGCKERMMERNATKSESNLSYDEILPFHDDSSSNQKSEFIILGVLGSICLLVVVFGGIHYAYNNRNTRAFDHHRLTETM